MGGFATSSNEMFKCLNCSVSLIPMAASQLAWLEKSVLERMDLSCQETFSFIYS
jgi:hypothetical protein